MADRGATNPGGPFEDPIDVADLIREIADLEETVDSQSERQQVRRVKQLAAGLAEDGRFGEYIGKYTTRDLAESFIGASLFAIPLLVEDGVFDIADHLLSVTHLGVPVFFVGNVLFIVLLTYGLIFWADIQRVEISRPLLGLVPRRLVGVLGISFLTVLAMMTIWGRVDGWREPLTALARITVVWTIAALGAGLGDIIPGESAGLDINDVLAER